MALEFKPDTLETPLGILVAIFLFSTPIYLFVLDVLTTGSNTGTQAKHHGHHGHHHQDDGTGVKPKPMDRVIGGMEKAAGKLTSDTEMYKRGEQRAVSWLSTSLYVVLNTCFECQDW